MTISNFKVTPGIIVPGESMHVEFTIKVTSSDDVNGLHIYGGNASNYMVYMDDDWTLAAGKSKTVSFDKALPKDLYYVSQNIGDKRTLIDPKWAIVLGSFGSRYEISNPVTYLNMRYLPTIAEFSMERASNGVANDEGENLLTSLRLSIADGADASDMHLKLYYAQNAVPTAASPCIELTKYIPSLLTGVKNSTSLVPGTFPNGNDWNFMLVFGDDYETTTAKFSLSRSFANIHMSGCKTGGICCGGFSSATEGNPKFESYYPIFAYGGIEPIETIYPSLSSGISTPGDYGGNLVFRRIGKLVIISGSIKLTSAASSKVICNLPANCIPANSHYYIGAMTGSQIARLAVYGSAEGVTSPNTLTLDWVKKMSSTSNVSSTQSWIDCSTVYWVN